MKLINLSSKTIAVLFLLIIIIPGLAAQKNREVPHSNIFEYKNRVAPFKSYKLILNNPTVIASHIKQNSIDGVKLLDTLFDLHAIYNISFNKLITKVLDLENEQNIYPRMIYTKDQSPFAPLWAPHLQEVKSRFTFGRIEENYH